MIPLTLHHHQITGMSQIQTARTYGAPLQDSYNSIFDQKNEKSRDEYLSMTYTKDKPVPSTLRKQIAQQLPNMDHRNLALLTERHEELQGLKERVFE